MLGYYGVNQKISLRAQKMPNTTNKLKGAILTFGEWNSADTIQINVDGVNSYNYVPYSCETTEKFDIYLWSDSKPGEGWNSSDVISFIDVETDLVYK